MQHSSGVNAALGSKKNAPILAVSLLRSNGEAVECRLTGLVRTSSRLAGARQFPAVWLLVLKHSAGQRDAYRLFRNDHQFGTVKPLFTATAIAQGGSFMRVNIAPGMVGATTGHRHTCAWW